MPVLEYPTKLCPGWFTGNGLWPATAASSHDIARCTCQHFSSCLLDVYCNVLFFCRASVEIKARTMLPLTQIDMQLLPLYTSALVTFCDSCTVHERDSCTSHTEKVNFAPFSCEDTAQAISSGTRLMFKCDIEPYTCCKLRPRITPCLQTRPAGQARSQGKSSQP